MGQEREKRRERLFGNYGRYGGQLYEVIRDNGCKNQHKIDDISYFNFNQKQTDVYTLWVEYPIEYKAYPKEYAGIIDLVDIKINAEQVV